MLDRSLFSPVLILHISFYFLFFFQLTTILSTVPHRATDGIVSELDVRFTTLVSIQPQEKKKERKQAKKAIQTNVSIE